MKKSMTIMVISLVIVFGGLLGFNLFKQYMTAQYFKTFKMPPVTISTIIATKKSWLPTISGIGNFTAVNGVDVNAQQSGHITKIDFSSGQYVKKNQLLIQLDQSIDMASLSEAKANLSLTKTNYKRQKELYRKKATSTSAVDTARANELQAQAAVDKIQAIINQKNIRAPFDGKLGVRLVNLGEYVSPGQTKIVTLQSQDPLYLQFYLPEHYLKELSVKQEVVFNVRAYKNFFFKGYIQALNSKVDSNTHNVMIQAQIANCPHPELAKKQPGLFKKTTEKTSGLTVLECNTKANNKSHVKEFAFIPGMFAKLNVIQKVIDKVIILPRTVINYSLYGNSVYVVEKVKDKKTGQVSLKAFQKFIKTGAERGTKVMILSGIKAGDEIVNSGQLKLQNGSDVLINNNIKLPIAKNIDALGQ